MTSESYAQAVVGLNGFAKSLQTLLTGMLAHREIQVHTIDYRIKSPESAQKKLDLKPGRYKQFSDLHDLLGLRITCYFSDQVDAVAELFEQEFEIDLENSDDKRVKPSPTEFGYMSLHYIAQLNAVRAGLPEYEQHKGKKFEVQIRTVLQHAWAEVEHDLGYKAATIPDPMRRRFSMLAGVLELVDYEFMSLRDGLADYQAVADNSAKSRGHDMVLDLATLGAVLKFDERFVSLDEDLARSVGKQIAGDTDSEYLETRLRELSEMGIQDMAHLRRTIRDWREHILEFAKRWYMRSDDLRQEEKQPQIAQSMTGQVINRGIGIFYLWMAYLANAGGNGEMVEFHFVDGENMPRIWRETVEAIGQEPPAIERA